MSDLTALTSVINRGDLNQVRTIRDANRELVHQRDEFGATALHYATLNGHREIVQLLLDRGAQINTRDNRFGATPTGWAIEYLRERGGYLSSSVPDQNLIQRRLDWLRKVTIYYSANRYARSAETRKDV